MAYEPNLCDDCRSDVDAIQEGAYIVVADLWVLLGEPRFLCIKCLEKRLGRELVVNDFDWSVPLTFLLCFNRSDKLISRMNGGPWLDISLNDFAIAEEKRRLSE